MAAKRKPRIPTSTLEDQLAASIEQRNAFRNASQLELISVPSESSGPALVTAIPAPPAPPKRPPSGGRVPYDVALRQITKTVTTILRDLGEQWDDESKQDMITTVLIAAAKDKKIDFDFTEAA